jgi:hypothetical protein
MTKNVWIRRFNEIEGLGDFDEEECEFERR